MRHFYIFQIHSSILKLTKENPYELYRSFETIYYHTHEDENLGTIFLHQLIEPIAMKDLDVSLFKKYKDNYFYMKYKNIHSMHDVYRKENTRLILHKTYLKLETDVIQPRFLEELQKNHNYFVCDFESADYFWIDSFSFNLEYI